MGLQIPQFTWSGRPRASAPKLAEIGRAADGAGFASVWTMDHFFQIGRGYGEAEEPMLEGYTALGFLAAATRNAKLGALVTGVNYRHPGILAKTVTTLDVLSGGRAYLGIGAGWYEREARALGTPFPPTAARFEWLEETLRIVRRMWSENNGPFEGEHFRLEETLNSPQPISRPHPPVMIGGTGEKKTLRLVAEYGDACNLFTFGADPAIARKLEVLRRHCDEVGRDYEEIEKTTLGVAYPGRGGMDAEKVVETCAGLAALGVEHAIFSLPDVEEIEPLERFGEEVIPAVADL